MAQDISLLGAVYPDVPAVQLPKQSGGMATFYDDTGTKNITTNGTHDVTGYASVSVDVAGGGGSGDGYVWQDENGYVHLSNEQGTQITVDPLSVTQNGTYTAQSGHAYSPVVVNVASGGGSVEEKQVNFIDYDGTILYSYTATEANALTTLPANPSHTGLTAQGWNWTLAQIKAQLTAMPTAPIWVGQMYVTTSGKSEIDICLPKERLSPYLVLAVNGTISIDWGDNTTPDTLTGTSLSTAKNIQHTYSTAGNYTISISVTSGNFAFFCPDIQGNFVLSLLSKSSSTSSTTAAKTQANAAFANSVLAVRIGTNASVGLYAFRNCYSLRSVSIPNTVTSIGEGAFRACYSLKSITIPNNVITINHYTFATCYSLEKVSIPYTVTSIGNYTFEYSRINNITISNAVTSIGNYAFNCCYSLDNIIIPNTVTSIGSHAFRYCYSLPNITIPNTVTSINTYTFESCYSLGNFTIQSTVTSISTYVFRYCYGLRELHLLPTTPPTLSNSNAFTSIPTDCIIYVPYSADHSVLEDYKTASNWSAYASYMQEESA